MSSNLTAIETPEPTAADATAWHVLATLVPLARVILTWCYRWPLAAFGFLWRCGLAIGVVALAPFRVLLLPVLMLWRVVTLPSRLVLDCFEPGDLQMMLNAGVSMAGAGILLGLTAGFVLVVLDARLVDLNNSTIDFLERRVPTIRRWLRQGRRGRVSAGTDGDLNEPSETSSHRSEDASSQDSDAMSSLSERAARQNPYTAKRRLPGTLLRETIHEEEDDGDESL